MPVICINALDNFLVQMTEAPDDHLEDLSLCVRTDTAAGVLKLESHRVGGLGSFNKEAV